MTKSLAIVPVYRALSIAGNVLVKNGRGEVYHTIVVHTTLLDEVHVVYVVKAGR